MHKTKCKIYIIDLILENRFLAEGRSLIQLNLVDMAFGFL